MISGALFSASERTGLSPLTILIIALAAFIVAAALILRTLTK